jgi:hypothetical protein
MALMIPFKTSKNRSRAKGTGYILGGVTLVSGAAEGSGNQLAEAN